MTMTLATGKTLNPVTFIIPRYADFTDIDGFIKKLTKSSTNPLMRAINLIDSLKDLANIIHSMAQTIA